MAADPDPNEPRPLTLHVYRKDKIIEALFIPLNEGTGERQDIASQGGFNGKAVSPGSFVSGRGIGRRNNGGLSAPDYQLSPAVVRHEIDEVFVVLPVTLRQKGGSELTVNFVPVFREDVVSDERGHVPGYIQLPTPYLGIDGAFALPEEKNPHEHGNKEQCEGHEECHSAPDPAPPPGRQEQA